MRNYNKRKKATTTKRRDNAAMPGSNNLATTEHNADATVERNHDDPTDVEVDTDRSDPIENKAETTYQHASVQKNDTNVEWTSDEQVDYEIDDEDNHEGEEDDALDSSTPKTYYSVDHEEVPNTVAYAAYKSTSSTIRWLVLKVLGSKLERTSSQIEFLQNVDFKRDDWPGAVNDPELIQYIQKLFSTSAQY